MPDRVADGTLARLLLDKGGVQLHFFLLRHLKLGEDLAQKA